MELGRKLILTSILALIAPGSAGQVVVGILMAVLAYERTFALAARYQRTGKPEAPPTPDAGKSVQSTPEGSALRHISEDAVQRGADSLIENAREAGFPLSRRDALEQARQMLSQTDLLGGAR